MQASNIPSGGEGVSRLGRQPQPTNPNTPTTSNVRSGQGVSVGPTTSASTSAVGATGGGERAERGERGSRGSRILGNIRKAVTPGGRESEKAAAHEIEGFPVVGKPPTAPSFPATIEMKDHVKTTKSLTRQLVRRSSMRELSTKGRATPKVTPQTIGRYISHVVGNWEGARPGLPARLVDNLLQLPHTDASEVRQLHMESALHFNCLCDHEKLEVLDTLAQKHADQLDTSTPASTPVGRFVEHMLLATPKNEADALHANLKDASQALLKPYFAQAGDTKVLSERFPEVSMTQPLDHMVDYGGFMEATNRVYGTLPKEAVERHNVCVVGGGPAGIMAADGLNRLGVKVHVFEQAGQIGGRLKTVRLEEVGPPGKTSGRESPTPLEMGGMRFAPFEGNSFYRLIKMYDLPTAKFINPSSKPGLLVVGREVIATEPGKVPDHPLLAEVNQEYEKAMEPLLRPIFAARAAGDTLKFRELCDAAIAKFDPTNFQIGMKELLKEQGITWSDDKWALYGAVGIGVGGYEGYYGTGFLEEFKFLADKRLEDHVFLPGGANSVLTEVVNDRNLPNGQASLGDQGAIQLNTAVDNIIRSTGADGHPVYEVTVKQRDAKGEVIATKTEKFTELIFAGGPHEAQRLGLTEPRANSEDLMTPALSVALRRANLVGATKLAAKVPREMLDKFEAVHGEMSGIQSSHLFQQMYVLPPAHKDATSRVVFLSYQLGDNATKTASMGGEEQFDVFTRIVRNIGESQPDSALHQKLAAFADVLETGRDRMAFEPWSQEKHFGGAFKMDRPMEQSNTQRMWETTLDKESTSAIFINEMMTAEGGFASGAVSSAINGVQQFIVRNGGELPPNSPLDQERLYPLN